MSEPATPRVRVTRLSLRDVPEYMPEVLESGVLYVSEEHEIAIHLCACGCGEQTVTPLGRGDWTLTRAPAGPTLTPSILNRICGAHYYVRDGAIDVLA